MLTVGIGLLLQSCAGLVDTESSARIENLNLTQMLKPGTQVSLQVTTQNYTDRFMAVKNSLGVIRKVSANSKAQLKSRSTFNVVEGLSDSACISLRPVTAPNTYLRHSYYRVRLDASDATELFKQDATWCVRPGRSGAGVSLESKNYPGSYLRHQSMALWLARPNGPRPADNPSNFNQNVSWKVVAPWAASGSTMPPTQCNADPDGAIPDEDVNATLTKVSATASKDSVEAMQVFFAAQNAYFRCDYQGARTTLDALWSRFPRGDSVWDSAGNVPDPVVSWTSYSGLKMLDFMVDQRLANPNRQPAERATWTAVVAACGEGPVAKNNTEFEANTGTQTRIELDPRLLADNAASLRQSTALFRGYYSAMTNYQTSLDLRVVRIPSCMPFTAGGIGEEASVGYDFTALLNKVPQDIKRSTDFWLAVSPIALPKNIPELAEKTWLVSYTSSHDNGVRTGTDNGNSPVFIASDGWLLDRKARSDIAPLLRGERQSYLPQWFDHEFYHMVFGAYQDKVDLGQDFSNGGHSWFTRSNWPSDFAGNNEFDFYDEVLKKRLLTYKTPVKDVLRWAER